MKQATSDLVTEIPVLPLRDMVVYPHGVHPLFVGTESSIRALEAAMATDKQVLLVAKRDADTERPAREDLFDVGTVSTLLQLLKLPDGTVKVLVEGGFRARILDFDDAGDYMAADVQALARTGAARRGRCAGAFADEPVRTVRAIVEESARGGAVVAVRASTSRGAWSTRSPRR